MPSGSHDFLVVRLSDRLSVYAIIGPLAIGNFNETMHGYGLDRQFRGQIRNVELFGNYTSSRGAAIGKR